MAVKFPLKMADGAMVRTIEALREHFDLAAVLSYYENGRLTKWLENGYYEEEAEKVAVLDPVSGNLVEELCEILGVDHSVYKTAQMDLDDITNRNRRLEQLKQLTVDDAILAAVDRVAFSQDDLSELLKKGITEIYLCGKKFVIPEGFEDNTYICMADSEIEFSCEIMGLKKAAERGDLEAQMKLGNGYFEGTFIKFTQDPIAEAVKWYQMAAEQGSAEGQVKLGHCYEYGQGVPQNVDTAIEWYKKASKQGFVDADVCLGKYWLNRARNSDSRKSHEPLYNEAVRWFTQAADKGSIIAKTYLGECHMSRARWYESTQYRDPLFQKAFRCIREAAEQGHVDAQYRLGVCYYRGEGAEQNYKLAAEWFKKAAEQGRAEAQFQLGNCYLYGNGVAIDRQKAVEWYRSAGELGQIAAQQALHEMEKFDYLYLNVVERGQGDAKSQTELGCCYSEGVGVARDYGQAVKWYQAAAEQNYARAQYLIGMCCHQGNGVERNDQVAVEWFRKAAEQGHPEAQYQLGKCYENGYGVRQIKKVAAEWYRAAAEQGYAEAQYALGLCYYYGDGVRESNRAAGEWFRKAAEQGHEKAKDYSYLYS